MSCELLTGATGFLGGYLLRDLLAAGREVVVLARSGRGGSAERRVRDVLEGLAGDEAADLRRLRVVEGDLSRNDLGMDAATRAWIAETCDRVVHCAASITFRYRAGEPYLSNVDGTRYLLELCREGDIRDFHLVSTAYVCGDRTGRVREDELECGQSFSNDYERSKYMGEVLVRGASFLDRWSVYRPSVIVGDSKTGAASSNDGLYAFLNLASLAAGLAPEAILQRLGLGADATLNLVPVDWLAAVVTHLSDRPDETSETYHLTNPRPLPVNELLPSVLSVVPDAPPVPAQALDGVLDVYRPYLREHCTFDASHTRRDAPDLECPAIEGEVLDRLLAVSATRSAGAPMNLSLRPEAVLLVVDGEGAFDLSEPGFSRPAPPDAVREARVRACCAADTLQRLLREELAVDEAVYAGVLALEGETSRMEHATFLLESFLAERRGPERTVLVGGTA